jgi:hypothetical protein
MKTTGHAGFLYPGSSNPSPFRELWIMNTHQAFPDDKKLTVISRVEPGCLGPQGHQHIDEFCRFAQKQADAIDSQLVRWLIVPRTDKTLAETQYEIGEKRLSRDKAVRFLETFDASLDEMEAQLDDNLSRLIERYLGR